MNRCVFIIPYFGKFNSYFELFLNSCGANQDFDWLIVTDDKRLFDYPDNVKVEYTDFYALKEHIQNLFDFNIRLEAPYKMCEYRLAYGEIFQNYIKNYEFWGFCDVDLIFGNIGNFITEDILDRYDKILFRGHMMLLRNNDKCLRMYRTRMKGMPIDYRYALTTDYCCHFDEHEMWGIILEKLGIKEYRNVVYADINCNSYPFKLVDGREGAARQIYEYHDGKLIRHYMKDGIVLVDEWCYIHLQKRKMHIEGGVDPDNYLIVPNAFIKIKRRLSKADIDLYSEKRMYISRRYDRVKEIIRNIRQGALKYRIHSKVMR